jgi:hypothetical protein
MTAAEVDHVIGDVKSMNYVLNVSGPHYLYRLRPEVKACLNYGKPVAQ